MKWNNHFEREKVSMVERQKEINGDEIRTENQSAYTLNYWMRAMIKPRNPQT